jgi:hypothetical protein
LEERRTEGSTRDVGETDRDSDVSSSEYEDWNTDDNASQDIDLEEDVLRAQ